MVRGAYVLEGEAAAKAAAQVGTEVVKEVAEHPNQALAAGAKVTAAAVPRSVIDDALASTAPATRLEGQVADHLGDRLQSFQRQVVGPGGNPIGEIDAEVSEAIIEVTIGKGGKVDQVTKLLTNGVMNPNGKPVIVFGPNMKKFAIQSIEEAGGYVVRSLDELDALLLTLGGP